MLYFSIVLTLTPDLCIFYYGVIRSGKLTIIIIFQVVEDGYEFFAKRQLVTLFSAPNYCGEFDNAGAMMSVDETLMCSFQILKVRIFVTPGKRTEVQISTIRL